MSRVTFHSNSTSLGAGPEGPRRAIKEAIARFTRCLREERTAVTGGEITGVRPLPTGLGELRTDRVG